MRRRISSKNLTPPSRFALGYGLLTGLCVLLLAAGLLWQLHGPGKPSTAWFRLLKRGAFCAYLLAFVWRLRGLAEEAGDALWGPANLLTLLRGLLIAALAGFLFVPRPAGRQSWVPCLVYTLIICLDFLDGWVARRSRTQTLMGSALDQELDGLGLLVAMALVVQYGVLPPLFLLVGIVHYLFALSLALRRRRGLPVQPLPPNRWRRRLAGFQMALAAAFLWPIARSGPALLTESLIALPFLLGFLRDWLVAGGRLAADGPLLTRWQALAEPWLAARLPLLLRAACLCLALAAFWTAAPGGIKNPVWPGPAPPGAAEAAASIAAGLTILALLGLATGRGVPFFALSVIALAGLPLYLAGMSLTGGLQLACALLLLLIGGGPSLSSLRARRA
jgi:CDP-diacylglycerol--glycerol-3-phosphate 3-phosphatidyltransferase